MPDDPDAGAEAKVNPPNGPPVVPALPEPAIRAPFWMRPLSAPNRVWVVVKTPVLVAPHKVRLGWPLGVKKAGFLYSGGIGPPFGYIAVPPLAGRTVR
jgi:hypothetical protein